MKDEDNRELTLILPGKRLRVGGVTYYVRDGKLMACASRRGKRKGRTEAEQAVTSRFAEVQRLWKVYRLATGNLPVWQTAARELGAHRGNTLFMRMNSGCVRAGEGVWAFDGFRFATGSLDVPLLRGARRVGEGTGETGCAGVGAEGAVGKTEGKGAGGGVEGVEGVEGVVGKAEDAGTGAEGGVVGGSGAGKGVAGMEEGGEGSGEGGVRVELEWERGEDGGGARWGDRVYVGYFGGGDGRSPGMVACEGVTRGDGRAEVVVPLERGEREAPLHVYLFFGSAEGTRFSPSVYAQV